ncbi:MAG: hypothetical protein HY067_01990 [Betaproteobacteria bacterium]|nr:hypothetical protein [Betaproteobacteria bacterium]
MKTKLALAGALLALAGPVSGAHWKPVSVTPERSIYIDMDALVRNGHTVQAWDWQKFRTGQTSATWQGAFFWVKSLTNYHCMQRTTDAVLKVYFGNDGVEIKRTHLEGLQFPAAVEPDSLREKMLEMACNPLKPAVKPVATATKPAVESKSAETKSPESEPTVSKGDPSAAKSDPAKADSNPAKAEEKGGAAAQAQSANPVVPRTKPAQTMKGGERQPYARTARMMSRKKLPPGVKSAKAKPQPDLKCPPPEQAGASEPVQPLAPAPQLTDAGNDGMFN